MNSSLPCTVEYAFCDEIPCTLSIVYSNRDNFLYSRHAQFAGGVELRARAAPPSSAFVPKGRQLVAGHHVALHAVLGDYGCADDAAGRAVPRHGQRNRCIRQRDFRLVQPRPWSGCALGTVRGCHANAPTHRCEQRPGTRPWSCSACSWHRSSRKCTMTQSLSPPRRAPGVRRGARRGVSWITHGHSPSLSLCMPAYRQWRTAACAWRRPEECCTQSRRCAYPSQPR